jgi:uncharacterized protein YdeI (YjbR/CyaY-like superfamily)
MARPTPPARAISGGRVQPRSRAEWRRWLAKHHATASEVWLVIAKAHTGEPRVSYDEAVEEALCFGWIDTTAQSLDEGHHMQRFTPRRPRSTWSQSNLDRFARLEAAGLMADAGRAALPPGTQPPPPRLQSGDAPPAWVAAALAQHPEASRFFATLAPGYRRDYLRWVTEAKREETRQRRLQAALRRLAAGEKQPQPVTRKDR